MDAIEAILPSKLFEILDRNGICTLKKIILLSTADIRRLTNLSSNDVKLIKTIVVRHLQPKCFKCDELISLDMKNEKIPTGCHGINHILNGGFRKGTITEIYGESGSGKTQIAIQTAVYNWASGCVYICTEDIFPIKRYEQMKRVIPNFNTCIDYGKNTFVEHITESDELLKCVQFRLPKLLSHNNVNIIVIDSIAAPFRVESTNYIQRAEDLRELANLFINIAQMYNLAILCINQVTSAFNKSSKEVLPSLGLAWSNMLCTRLWLKKLNEPVNLLQNKNYSTEHSVNVRELSVEFSSELPYSTSQFVITSNGINDV